MRIAVLGGTGLMGRLVVEQAKAAGHAVVVAARSTGVDLSTGEGLKTALDGVESVVDVSDHQALAARKAVGFFETAARNITEAERRAGVEHHILLSIVNCDDPQLAGFGYYQGKAAQEWAVQASGVPCTILRSTQWFEFGEKMLALAGIGPVAMVPHMKSQPVAAKTVAEALVTCLGNGPAGPTADLAGPEVMDIVDMTREIVHHRGQRRWLVPVSLPGAGRAMREGALLPRPDATIAGPKFREWLDGM